MSEHFTNALSAAEDENQFADDVFQYLDTNTQLTEQELKYVVECYGQGMTAYECSTWITKER